ncbi:MAG: nucleotide exchange factor GrpE [Clostridia bacterium]|nr:nucleotide exchange factor GrpE [Clostridia bacterium]
MEEKETVSTEETASAETKEEKADESEKAVPEKETGKKKSDTKKCKADLANAKEEKEALEKELAEEKDRYLRLAAEYDNFRRRSQKEKEGIYADAIVDAVKEILPLFDNLERAGQYKEAEKVAEGLAMMAKMSDGMLEKLGVTRFGAVGEKFDAEWHNAVMHEENEAFGENEIAQVFQEGYRRGDKVIRFAMVKVAN